MRTPSGTCCASSGVCRPSTHRFTSMWPTSSLRRPHSCPSTQWQQQRQNSSSRRRSRGVAQRRPTSRFKRRGRHRRRPTSPQRRKSTESFKKRGVWTRRREPSLGGRHSYKQTHSRAVDWVTFSRWDPMAWDTTGTLQWSAKRPPNSHQHPPHPPNRSQQARRLTSRWTWRPLCRRRSSVRWASRPPNKRPLRESSRKRQRSDSTRKRRNAWRSRRERNRGRK
mmetsp:Transcript_14300/g.41101  ORF Transcript_14300/g.41101 Transcript_14300/m.41101 type:complete len:223 (+) Transcript_14300:2163-2831(+)